MLMHGPPTTDIDEMIRENFMARFQTYLHDEIYEFLYKSTAALVVELKDLVMKPEVEVNVKDAFITLMRFLDALQGDGLLSDDDFRPISYMKSIFAQHLCQIAANSTDLHLLKMTALVLGNQQKSLLNASDEQMKCFLYTFVSAAEMGQKMLRTMGKQDF